jgi:hypothetical protein
MSSWMPEPAAAEAAGRRRALFRVVVRPRPVPRLPGRDGPRGHATVLGPAVAGVPGAPGWFAVGPSPAAAAALADELARAGAGGRPKARCPRDGARLHAETAAELRDVACPRCGAMEFVMVDERE